MRRSLVNDMAVVDYVNPLRQRQRCRQILFERPAARGCDAFAQSYVASDRIWREARRPLSPTALQATKIYNCRVTH
jgi:hypothetical protein